MRIGVNTGEVTAGNVGAPGRSNYGIVGDAVNTTQRIEQLAKDGLPRTGRRPPILVSARPGCRPGTGFAFTDAGAHAVRGRQELVRIFRLRAPVPETAPEPGGALPRPAGHRPWLADSAHSTGCRGPCPRSGSPSSPPPWPTALPRGRTAPRRRRWRTWSRRWARSASAAGSRAASCPTLVVCPGDQVAVGPNSRAAVYLIGADTPLRLDESTVGRFEPPPEPGSGIVELARGAIYFLSQVRRTLTIRTPYVNAGVEGTEVYLGCATRRRPPHPRPS